MEGGICEGQVKILWKQSVTFLQIALKWIKQQQQQKRWKGQKEEQNILKWNYFFHRHIAGFLYSLPWGVTPLVFHSVVKFPRKGRISKTWWFGIKTKEKFICTSVIILLIPENLSLSLSQWLCWGRFKLCTSNNVIPWQSAGRVHGAHFPGAKRECLWYHKIDCVCLSKLNGLYTGWYQLAWNATALPLSYSSRDNWLELDSTMVQYHTQWAAGRVVTIRSLSSSVLLHSGEL